MALKTHHLVAASDGKTITRLTHIYAETFEEASLAARKWCDETCPDLCMLTVRSQPQGFQAGFTRLPGIIVGNEVENVDACKASRAGYP